MLTTFSLCIGLLAFAKQPVESIPTADIAPMAAVPTPNIAQPEVAEALMYALSLIGVKYRYGGNTAEQGFDCSGFVNHVFSETLSLPLPRSAIGMSKVGLRIDQQSLQPGDLVFYKTLKRAFSHVGLYIGDGRFVHAPSSGKTVEIIDMSNTYWRKRFNGARRVVPSLASLQPAISIEAEAQLGLHPKAAIVEP